MRRLPDDVLREVFRACTKSPDQFDWDVIIKRLKIDIESVQPNQSPGIVSCVCQQWRTVTIDTRELWSFIGLDLDRGYRNKELAKNRAFMLGLSLFRANGHDLFIRLYGEKNAIDVDPILPIPPPQCSVLEATISLSSSLLITTLFNVQGLSKSPRCSLHTRS